MWVLNRLSQMKKKNIYIKKRWHYILQYKTCFNIFKIPNVLLSVFWYNEKYKSNIMEKHQPCSTFLSSFKWYYVIVCDLPVTITWCLSYLWNFNFLWTEYCEKSKLFWLCWTGSKCDLGRAVMKTVMKTVRHVMSSIQHSRPVHPFINRQ